MAFSIKKDVVEIPCDKDKNLEEESVSVCFTQRDLAKAIGIHYVYLNSIFRGRRKASAQLAKRIERLTMGAIKASVLRPDIFD